MNNDLTLIVLLITLIVTVLLVLDKKVFGITLYNYICGKYGFIKINLLMSFLGLSILFILLKDHMQCEIIKSAIYNFVCFFASLSILFLIYEVFTILPLFQVFYKKDINKIHSRLCKLLCDRGEINNQLVRYVCAEKMDVDFIAGLLFSSIELCKKQRSRRIKRLVGREKLTKLDSYKETMIIYSTVLEALFFVAKKFDFTDDYLIDIYCKITLHAIKKRDYCLIEILYYYVFYCVLDFGETDSNISYDEVYYYFFKLYSLLKNAKQYDSCIYNRYLLSTFWSYFVCQNSLKEITFKKYKVYLDNIHFSFPNCLADMIPQEEIKAFLSVIDDLEREKNGQNAKSMSSLFKTVYLPGKNLSFSDALKMHIGGNYS